MGLTRRISRQPGFRQTVAGVQVACALASATILVSLGAPLALILGVPAIIALAAAGVAFAPTETMDERWFHVLPVLISLLTTMAMWATAPNPGPVSFAFVFVGALAVFTVPTWPGIFAHLIGATLLLFSPVIAGQSEQVSTLAILAAATGMWSFAALTRMVRIDVEDTAQQLDDLSRHDALTGLRNRRVIDERLAEELAWHEEHAESLALVLLDLNGFKRVNDALGNAAGDQLLKDVSAALAAVVRDEDVVGRQGGDEFCVLAPGTDREGAEGLVRRIRGALAQVQALGAPVEAGVGFAIYPEDGTSARTLFEAADVAQMRNKPAGGRAGRGRLARVS